MYNINKKRPRSSSKVKKKRSIIRPSEKLINKIQVPLTNKFEALADNGEDITDVDPPAEKLKVSPIVVTDIDIQSIITSLKVNVETKIITIGKKIFAKSADDKKKITEAFTAAKINFFTHPDNVNKVFKAVLTGLPEMDTSSIVNSMKETYNINVTKIIMFNTKSHNKLYLCQFDRVEVNMKVLNTIKAVCMHIVKWQPFKPKQNSPTQCYRCTMYGHGASSCMRFAVCMLCAGNHITKECSVIKPDANEPVYKCFNCVDNKLPHNHKASDPNCPFRTKYIATRANVRDKNKQNTQTPPLNNIDEFPAIPNRYVRAPQPPPLRSSSYATAIAQSDTHASNKQSNAYNQMPSASNVPNLWSIAEVTNLLLNSINDLKQCQSKLDQLKIIATLLQNACE